MTSGLMKCPKCYSDFRYADYDSRGNWVEFPEPWNCPNPKCGIKICLDREKGYGLKEDTCLS